MPRPPALARPVDARLATLIAGLGLSLGLAAAPAPALAGDGPWTLGEGDQNIYLGLDYFRYRSFNSSFSTGSGMEHREADLSSGITASGLTGVWTVGLARGFEAELKLPVESVRVNRPEEDASCQQPPRKDFCEPTTGLGDVGITLKARLVEERYVSPVSLAASLSVRTGEAYAGKRGRLTTLGDGQTDLGAGLSVGRTDVMAKGWYRVAATSHYYYRFPNNEVAGTKVPADEITYSFTSTFAPVSRFGIGPVLYGFERLGGVDFRDRDVSSQDAWASLDAAQLQVGGELGVYAAEGGPSVAFALLHTVHARNNPSDTLVLSMGIGWYLPGRSAALLEEIEL